MTHLSAIDRSLRVRESRPSFRTVLEGTGHTLALWQQRHSSRRALCELDTRQLKDIGLSRADVARECSKSFWRE